MASIRLCTQDSGNCVNAIGTEAYVAPTCPEESPLEHQPADMVGDIVAVTQRKVSYPYRWNWLPSTASHVVVKYYHHEGGSSQIQGMQDTRELCFYKTAIRNYQKNSIMDEDPAFHAIVGNFAPHYFGTLKPPKTVPG